MSSDEISNIIKVFHKFLDPNSVKLEKLSTIDDILKLPILSYKFIDKEESTMIKQLMDITKIREASNLNKENPF